MTTDDQNNIVEEINGLLTRLDGHTLEHLERLRDALEVLVDLYTPEQQCLLLDQIEAINDIFSSIEKLKTFELRSDEVGSVSESELN
jgi:hypothetical protein